MLAFERSGGGGGGIAAFLSSSRVRLEEPPLDVDDASRRR
jgi:hypothetical protein